MQVLISCAKTMGCIQASVPEMSLPHFSTEAAAAVRQLLSFSPEMLRSMLHVNAKIAAENALRFSHFFDETETNVPALLAYTGIVFKYIRPGDFTSDDFYYAQQHLFITSFLYGLLRPLDGIRPYRLEGNVHLPDATGPDRFEFWRPCLTDMLLNAVKADDGILINLASNEMKRLFDWKRVEKEVRIITPDFTTIKEGRERSIVIYTKMCRGEMTRFILKNRLVSPVELEAFEPISDLPVITTIEG